MSAPLKNCPVPTTGGVRLYTKSQFCIEGRSADSNWDSLAYAKPLSYSHLARLPDRMRRPDRTELEFTMLLFGALAPLGYLTMRFFFELVG
ncbi:hypothetical protein ACWPM1_13795 [Tsuneonella sp. HG249]